MVVTGEEILERLQAHFSSSCSSRRDEARFKSEICNPPSAIGHGLLTLAPASRIGLLPVQADNPSSTSQRWAFPDGRGEIGIIAPVSEPFCGHCNRIRLTADGKIRTCLFSVTEHDLRSRLRNGTGDDGIAEWVRRVIWQKEERHHIGEPEFIAPPRSMSCIGG
jgi:molybdenum cofactor biosynthesis enzyme MoaA